VVASRISRYASAFIRSRRAGALAAAGLMSMLAGCTADAFNVTQQCVRVRVTQVESGVPASMARLDVEARYYSGWMSQLKESERDDLWFARGMNEPTTTDAQGIAKVCINIGTIRGGLFPKAFDPRKDRLTGQPYMFRVRQGDVAETLHVVMVVGHRSRGRTFEVSVLSIGPSKDVTRAYTAPRRTNETSVTTQQGVHN
jgi:hypothetical protein